MNADRILDIIGDTKGSYILDAQLLRSGEQFSSHRVTTYKRIWIIAAAFLLLLALVGCTIIYFLQADDLIIGQKFIIGMQGVDDERNSSELDILSLQGIQNSNVYRANQEWLDFTQSYEPELVDYWESDEEYWSYNVLNQTMVDKLDEICTRYDLKLIGKPWHEHVDCSEFLHLAGIDSLLEPESACQVKFPQGRFFPGGSFTVYGNAYLSDADDPVYLTYHYVKKDVFYDVFAYIDTDTSRQWNHTTQEGINLLLIHSDSAGMIFCDCADAFISISIDNCSESELQKMADQFDYSIESHIIDAGAAQLRENSSFELSHGSDWDPNLFARDSYSAYVEDILATGFSDSTISQREYAFHDLDGNGSEELLIIQNGYISNVVGWMDGKTDEGKTYNMILCQDNVLIDIMQLTMDECWYHIFRFANDGDPVFSNPKEESIVRLKEVNGIWWRTSSTDHYADFDTQITEEEAMKLLKYYVPVILEKKPLSEFEEQ